jgi:hypothetical protein
MNMNIKALLVSILFFSFGYIFASTDSEKIDYEYILEKDYVFNEENVGFFISSMIENSSNDASLNKIEYLGFIMVDCKSLFSYTNERLKDNHTVSGILVHSIDTYKDYNC